jgi:hypothetical protein
MSMSTSNGTDDPFGDEKYETPLNSAPPEAAEEKPVRGGPVISGKRLSFPPPRPFPAWASPDAQDRNDGVDEDIDYSDLDAVNKDLLRLRIRLNRVRRAMRQASREAVEAKLAYHRALRRALVQQSGGTAETRRATAELLCEDLEADMVMKLQVADEFVSVFRAVRDDVENAKTVAYNLRALINLV